MAKKINFVHILNALIAVVAPKDATTTGEFWGVKWRGEFLLKTSNRIVPIHR